MHFVIFLLPHTPQVIQVNSLKMRHHDVQRYAAFGLGIAELLFYGGLVYGWSTLVFVLKAEGYYSNLCKNETIDTMKDTIPPTSSGDNSNTESLTCSQQDTILNLVFTVGTFSLQGVVFCIGLLFDYFGTRFIRIFLQ